MRICLVTSVSGKCSCSCIGGCRYQRQYNLGSTLGAARHDLTILATGSFAFRILCVDMNSLSHLIIRRLCEYRETFGFVYIPSTEEKTLAIHNILSLWCLMYVIEDASELQ